MGFRAALIVCLLAGAADAARADETAAADRIKAAFLYKFAAYVVWPATVFAGAESPIVIGVAGADRIAEELEQASAGRTVGDRAVVVRRLATGDAPKGCQILFIGGDRRRAEDVLARAQGQPVLTVTDALNGHPRGSTVHFIVSDGRMRFDISREPAERAGLQLRSQLLAVARQVLP